MPKTGLCGLLSLVLLCTCVSCYLLPYKTVDFSEEQDLTAQFNIHAAPYDRTGYAYYYIKSDLKGKNPCHVWIYYPESLRSESFKIYQFAKLQGATDLVCADYNETTFMPDAITAYLVKKDGERVKNAVTEYSGFTAKASYKDKTQEFSFGIIPSFFYNFDWADLNSMIPYLKEKHTSFNAGFISPDNSTDIQYQGNTSFEYTGQSVYKDVLCDVFTVVVQGLEDKKGMLYVDADNSDVIEINMELPNNPGFNSFLFSLQSKAQMTVDEWNAFILAKTAEAL